MSLISALYSGATGLDASSTELSVVGDNIANANTIGFKGSRAAFADAMAQTLIGNSPGGTAGQNGLGVRLQMVQRILTQGSLANTGMATDLGIEGSGFFMVNGPHGGQAGNYYTRAGQFTVDESGFLVNLEGLKVQGYQADTAGTLSTVAVGDLQVGNASSSPRMSANITMRANLDANAVTPTAAWAPAQAATTSNFSSTVNAFDSLGNSHQIDTYFRKNAAGAWEWHALTDGGGLTGGTAGTATEVASGTATFDAQGRLATVATTVNAFNPIGATNPQPLTFNFGDPTGAGGTGLAGITQFAAPSASSFINQDGYASGELARISIDPKGQILGIFTNGQSRMLGQVAIANFEAPDQLRRVGGNLFTEAPGSGPATVGAAATADRGSIISGTLEQSNVDLASEFIRMIAAQRGFQANSKTLTTADQLLQELMTIKR